MKTNFFILLTALLLGAANGFAQSGTTGDLTWVLDENGTLTISGTGDMPEYGYASAPWHTYKDNIKTLVIENGVTSIADSAFEEYTNLISVSLGNSLKSIGNFVFNGCSALASIALPASLETIGFKVFSHTALTSVNIPASVTAIGVNAFGYISTLSAIAVEADNSAYSSRDGVLFNKAQDTLVCHPGGKPETNYIIPETVKTIGRCAFDDCTRLTSVSIPVSVTAIESSAFSGCSGLTDVSIPASVTSIKEWAFGYCTGLSVVFVSWDDPAKVAYEQNIFGGVNVSDVLLMVLPGKTEAYQNVAPWNDFFITENESLVNALLATLTVNHGRLSPAFSPTVFSYRTIVFEDVESITLTATPYEAEATVTGAGEHALNMGENSFPIVVTAPDGTTQRTYRVNVLRLPGDYSLEYTGYTDVSNATISNGSNTLPIITDRNLYYTLTTGNTVSGDMPLHFNLGNGIAANRTIPVLPNSIYRITLAVSLQVPPSYLISVTTPYDAYGRPGTPYINYTYSSCTITASDGENTLSITETTVPWTIKGATVSDVTYTGSTTPIVEIKATPSIAVYPNPAKEYLRLSAEQTVEKLEIYNSLGRLAMRKTNVTDRVDVVALPAGWYIVRLHVNDTVVTQKVRIEK